MRRHLAVLLLAAAPVFIATAADDPSPPAWLTSAASQTIPAQGPKVPAIVLIDEQTTTVAEDGLVVERRIKAVKILQSAGRDEAVAAESYIQKAGKVREIRAWLIEADGKAQFYGKNRIADVAMRGDALFGEHRYAMINARNDARPGTIFGFEITSESRTVFTQFTWAFQDNLPTLLSRFHLTLPAGWEIKSAMMRHPDVAPQVSGNTYTWELANLPFIEAESSSPSVSSLVPRLAVGYLPPEGSPQPGRVIRNWNDVSAWMAELADPQTVPDAAITAKARELTAGAASEWDKIRAISRYAQSVKYVLILTGVAKGGGYKPHAASDVFAKSYGDCKDKAVLMRALLKAIGIESYDVSIYSGDRTYVDAKFATPRQFNHAIVAVKVSDASSLKSPAVVEAPGLGHLLIFDPTDDVVPLGHLPQHEQGSLALIAAAAGAQGKLLRMPVIPASENTVTRKMRVQLKEDGSADATVDQSSAGSSAARSRSLRKESTEADFRKIYEHWISAEVPGSTISKLEAADDGASETFRVNLAFASPRYGRRMNQRMLMARPTPVTLEAGPDVSKSARQRPVLLNARVINEETVMDLPAGFTVDETPEALKLDTPFGSFEGACEIKGSQLIARRRLELRHLEVPAADYAKLREFLNTVNGHSAAVAVLVKK